MYNYFCRKAYRLSDLMGKLVLEKEIAGLKEILHAGISEKNISLNACYNAR